MEQLRDFVSKKILNLRTKGAPVNLNESQIALLREEAESFLATTDGERALRELYVLEEALHCFWGTTVDSRGPKHLWYSNLDYKRHPEKFIVTNYLHAFYVTGANILTTTGEPFQHRSKIEKRLERKIPGFAEKLRAGTIRAVDGATAGIRDTDINLFVPIMNPVGYYREETLKDAADKLSSRGYLVLHYWNDEDWLQEQLRQPEFEEYAHAIGLEWFDRIDYVYEHPDMKYPEFRYNWKLI